MAAKPFLVYGDVCLESCRSEHKHGLGIWEVDENFTDRDEPDKEII